MRLKFISTKVYFDLTIFFNNKIQILKFKFCFTRKLELNLYRIDFTLSLIKNKNAQFYNCK